MPSCLQVLHHIAVQLGDEEWAEAEAKWEAGEYIVLAPPVERASSLVLLAEGQAPEAVRQIQARQVVALRIACFTSFIVLILK